MAEDPLRTRHDREPVSLAHGYEVRHWCRVFGCSEPALRAAVAAVGTSARRVREFLEEGEQRSGGPPEPLPQPPGA